jgi:hypothetical protein
MSLAEKLLNSISAMNVEAEDIFADPKSGDICRAFYAIHDKKKRRLLVCVTEEYSEDVLNNKSGFDQTLAALRRRLIELSERVKSQKAQFEREDDFVFSQQCRA